MKSLTLFTRQQCALCDNMVLALEVLRPHYNFEYAKVDIDINDEQKERYGLRVPVLMDSGHEICAGHCEPAILEAYFSKTSDQ